MNLRHLILKNPGISDLYWYLKCKTPGAIKLYKLFFGLPPVGFREDRIFQKAIKTIILSLPITSFVETGTYLGDSTEFVANLKKNLPIFTCEINKILYRKARGRLKRFKNVKVIKDSSPEFLRNLIESNLLGDFPLFFLDAHDLSSYLPLENELEIITSSLDRAIIVIDDFQVPERPEFSFWKQGEKILGLELIKPKMSKKNLYWVLLPCYSYNEAFPKDKHSTLDGYVIIFQNFKKGSEYIENVFSNNYFKIQIKI